MVVMLTCAGSNVAGPSSIGSDGLFDVSDSYFSRALFLMSTDHFAKITAQSQNFFQISFESA